MQTTDHATLSLPENVQRGLKEFIAAAQKSFAAELKSVVLYGSGAENKLRSTSDVNLIVVLTDFNHSTADSIREPLRLAEATIRLRAMFLLESEIPSAAAAFAQKFADILRRHVVLYGADPFLNLQIPRDAEVFRLKQVLLNLVLRFREMYLSRSQREEQLARVIADAAGPLRSSAATILELEGNGSEPSSKPALVRVARELGADRDSFSSVLQSLSSARETGVLPAGAAPKTLLGLIELAGRMHERAQKLREEES